MVKEYFLRIHLLIEKVVGKREDEDWKLVAQKRVKKALFESEMVTYLRTAMWDVLCDGFEFVFEAFRVINGTAARHQDSMAHNREQDYVNYADC